MIKGYSIVSESSTQRVIKIETVLPLNLTSQKEMVEVFDHVTRKWHSQSILSVFLGADGVIYLTLGTTKENAH